MYTQYAGKLGTAGTLGALGTAKEGRVMSFSRSLAGTLLDVHLLWVNLKSHMVEILQ